MNSKEKYKNLPSTNSVFDEEYTVYKSQFIGLDDKPCNIKCVLCDEKFVLPEKEKELLSHLFKEHRLVIGDVWNIASLKSYIHYWSVKFKEEPLTKFCTTMLMNCTPSGEPSKNEKYYLLSDCISEDKTLRDEIHQAKLEWVLSEQATERTDTNFKRGCMFCRTEFFGLRITYIKHLAQKHNLYLGKPDNLVFIDEFLDKIQTSIENLICIYCEKLFKDRTALKEHMRKKLHKRINPHNKEYDKFYINNYLEPGKSWRHKQITCNENDVVGDQSSENEDEDTWSDWNDEGTGISCLFCSYSNKHFHLILVHMKTEHDFDFKIASKDLTFYQKVKIVNYVRRQIYLEQCVFCGMKMDNVLEHMKEQNHFKIPIQKVWDQPEYYFPMHENESFLYNLDVSSTSDEESDIENITEAINDYIQIKVIGIINTIAFQRARLCAEKLYQHLPFKFSIPQIIEMFQVEWHEYILKMKRQIGGGKIWSLTRTVAVFINNKFLGSDVQFLNYICQDYIFSLPISVEYYENLATECCKKFMEKSKRKYVYFTFSIDDSPIGSFVFMLYSDLLPLTCQYFLNLCSGYDEMQKCYKNAYYINTHLHRIVKNGWIQCGGFESSELDKNADDVKISESYCVPHDRRGVLSLTNDGKHCNKSQFIICLKPNPWMNHFYVAFGQLIDGAKTLKMLEDISTYYEHPIKEIVISQCGEYIFGDEIKMETESKIFLRHQPSASIEGDVAFTDTAFDFYSITSWLDNIVDRLDVRDTVSLLMVERYLNGFYCLSSDYEPEMDMRVHEKIHLVGIEKYDTTTAKLHELLLNFQPDIMTEREKLTFISEISKIILAYIFHHEHNEFCLQHISMNTHGIIHKILEVAHEIVLKSIKKATKESIISPKYESSKIEKIFELKHVNNILVSEECMSLLEEILNKAILCLIKCFKMQEE